MWRGSGGGGDRKAETTLQIKTLHAWRRTETARGDTEDAGEEQRKGRKIQKKDPFPGTWRQLAAQIRRLLVSERTDSE